MSEVIVELECSFKNKEELNNFFKVIQIPSFCSVENSDHLIESTLSEIDTFNELIRLSFTELLKEYFQDLNPQEVKLKYIWSRKKIFVRYCFGIFYSEIIQKYFELLKKLDISDVTIKEYYENGSVVHTLNENGSILTENEMSFEPIHLGGMLSSKETNLLKCIGQKLEEVRVHRFLYGGEVAQNITAILFKFNDWISIGGGLNPKIELKSASEDDLEYETIIEIASEKSIQRCLGKTVAQIKGLFFHEDENIEVSLENISGIKIVFDSDNEVILYYNNDTFETKSEYDEISTNYVECNLSQLLLT